MLRIVWSSYKTFALPHYLYRPVTRGYTIFAIISYGHPDLQKISDKAKCVNEQFTRRSLHGWPIELKCADLIILKLYPVYLESRFRFYFPSERRPREVSDVVEWKVFSSPSTYVRIRELWLLLGRRSVSFSWLFIAGKSRDRSMYTYARRKCPQKISELTK